MKCKHWKNNHIGKKSIDYNVDGTWIFDNPHAFNFVISKIICPQKIDPTYGFQPSIPQVNANIYINNFFPRRLITE